MNPKKWLFCCIISLFVGMILEVLLGNARELFHGGGIAEAPYKIEAAGSRGEEKLTEEEKNSILIARENEKILAELKKEPYQPKPDNTLVERDGEMYREVYQGVYEITFQKPWYLGKLHIKMPESESPGRFSVEAESLGKTVFLKQDGFLDERLSASVLAVNENVDKIIIKISCKEEFKPGEVSFLFSNSFTFSVLRFFFFSVAVFLVLIYLTSGKWIAGHVAECYAITAVLAGMVLVGAIGTNQAGFDEHVHMKQAYNLSFGDTVETTESIMQYEAATFPSFYSKEERILVEEYAQKNHDYSWANITHQSLLKGYDVRSYYPSALLFFVGRVLHLPFIWMLLLAKAGNLLFYVLITYFAVKLSGKAQIVTALVCMLPNNLFAASCFTYDAVVNGFLILAVVLTLRLLYKSKGEVKKITWLDTIFLLGCYICGSTAKPIYIVMALILIFLPATCFEGKGREVVYKTMVLILAGLMMYVIFFPPVSADSNFELIGNLAYAGDKRNQGTSVIGQIQYILGAPFSYAALLMSSMIKDALAYLSGAKQLLNFGYLGGLSVVFTWIYLGILVFSSIFAPVSYERFSIGRKFKILQVCMVFLVACIIWTSMYVSFTPVGNPEILGVQARYFIPLCLPLLSCLYQNKHKIPIQEQNYNRILLGSAAAVNLYAVGVLAVFARNI